MCRAYDMFMGSAGGKTVFSLIISTCPSVQTQDCQTSWQAKNVSQSCWDLTKSPSELSQGDSLQTSLWWPCTIVAIMGKSKITRLYDEIGQSLAEVSELKPKAKISQFPHFPDLP